LNTSFTRQSQALTLNTNFTRQNHALTLNTSSTWQSQAMTLNTNFYTEKSSLDFEYEFNTAKSSCWQTKIFARLEWPWEWPWTLLVGFHFTHCNVRNLTIKSPPLFTLGLFLPWTWSEQHLFW
jgi:hypothetical protein